MSHYIHRLPTYFSHVSDTDRDVRASKTDRKRVRFSSVHETGRGLEIIIVSP